jgi:hypothetical protein
MVTKKDLVIAVLATFCLTVSLFTIIPTRSLLPTDSVNASKPEYDPWLDYNEDGIVDISDILDTSLAFGSTGDPTKNVYVVQMSPHIGHTWENEYIYWFAGLTTLTTTGWHDCRGYSTMYIYLRVMNISSNQYATTTVTITFIQWIPDVAEYPAYHQAAGQPTLTLTNIDTNWAVAKYEIQGSYCRLQVDIKSQLYSGNARCSICYYLRNE